MGKIARRSIKSDDPSSPPSTTTPSFNFFSSQKRHQSSEVSRLRSSRSTSDNHQTTPTIGIGRPQNQTKNVENKTSTIQQPPPSTSSSSSSSTSTSTRTEKPPTTTYKAFTTSYKSTPAQRTHWNHTVIQRGDKLSDHERLKLRKEFFETYDVMTGIRIAATLGSFFVLMVFLIVYKSRSHTHKALKDPKIQAQAAQTVQDEEDRELQEAFEKTAFSLYADEFDMSPEEMEMQRDRILSLGNVSCPPYLFNPNIRFSSFGGQSSLLDPSLRRLSSVALQRRESNSDSSRILSAYHLHDNYCNQNENFFNESEGDEEDADQRFTTTAEISGPQGFLSVPRSADSRRSSGMTCCSTESSFLERRCSAITLGLSSYSRCSSRRQSQSREMWENEIACGGSGHPGINVIEPTPKSSPCPSERQQIFSNIGMMKDHIRIMDRFKRKRQDDNSIDSISEYPDENNHQYRSEEVELSESIAQVSKTLVASETLPQPAAVAAGEEIRRAPLASLSSFKMSSVEFQSEVTNGSVFEDSCADDTDDDVDMEQFSTDSDELSLQSPPLTDKTRKPSGAVNSKAKLNVDEKKLDVMTASSSGRVSSASDKKSKSNSSECITINVVECKNDDQNVKPSSPVKPSTSPSSVILEMPILVKQGESSSNNLSENIASDPSQPSARRKWSKETLF